VLRKVAGASEDEVTAVESAGGFDALSQTMASCADCAFNFSGKAMTPFRQAITQLLLFFAETYRC
jgi:hypothetical protein